MPLSGTMKKQSRNSTHTISLLLPTPGSTTATWIVPLGKILIGGRKEVGAAKDVLGLDVVADINNRCGRIDTGDNTLHNANICILISKVRQEGNHWRAV